MTQIRVWAQWLFGHKHKISVRFGSPESINIEVTHDYFKKVS